MTHRKKQGGSVMRYLQKAMMNMSMMAKSCKMMPCARQRKSDCVIL